MLPDEHLVSARMLAEMFRNLVAGSSLEYNGTPIRSTRVGVAPYDRPTYWCPRCQPNPQRS